MKTYSTVPVERLFTIRPNGSFENSMVYCGFSLFLVAVGTEMGTSNLAFDRSVIYTQQHERNKLQYLVNTLQKST